MGLLAFHWLKWLDEGYIQVKVKFRAIRIRIQVLLMPQNIICFRLSFIVDERVQDAYSLRCSPQVYKYIEGSLCLDSIVLSSSHLSYTY